MNGVAFAATSGGYTNNGHGYTSKPSSNAVLDKILSVCEANQQEIAALKAEVIALGEQTSHQTVQLTSTYEVLNDFHDHWTVWRRELTKATLAAPPPAHISFEFLTTKINDSLTFEIDRLLGYQGFESIKLIK